MSNTHSTQHQPLRGRRKKLFSGLALLVAVVFPMIAAAPANADSPDPVGNLLGAVQQATTPPVGGGADHASSSAAGVTSHDTKLVEVSGNHAGTSSSGQPKAHGNVVSVAGRPVVGSHSEVPASPLCARSQGTLCVRALHADSATTPDSAASSTGVLTACVGGSDPSGASCSGQQLGVAQGSAAYGPAGSSSSASVLAVCLRMRADCDLTADVLSSSSGTGAVAPDLASVRIGGTTFALPRDTLRSEVPTGCVSPDVACLALNDVHGSSSGDTRDAVTGDVVGDALGVSAGSSASDTPQGSEPVTTDPVNGASAQLVDLGTTDQPLLGVSQNSSADDGEQAQGDATLLSVLGTELIGSHSSSPGSSEHGTAVANPLCAWTSGSVCAELLYADSSADHRADGSDVDTRTGVADLCVGGQDPSGSQCSGLSAGVADGESHFHRAADGSAASSSGTSLATTCLAGDVGCVASADVLESHGAADSNGGHQSGGTVAGVALGGTQAGAPGDPLTASVPMGCTGSVLCAVLNQNQQGAGTGSGAGTKQTVLTVGTVNGMLGFTGASTATGATAVSAPTGHQPTTGQPAMGSAPSTSSPMGQVSAADQPGSSGPLAAIAGVLPRTGGPWVGALPLALAMLLTGGMALVRSRRRIS